MRNGRERSGCSVVVLLMWYDSWSDFVFVASVRFDVRSLGSVSLVVNLRPFTYIGDKY